jgi:transposase-like protein
MVDLTDPIFNDETAAREHLERVRWPEGPVCPHCGTTGEAITKVGGTKGTHRPGLYYCNGCKGQFTVTVGTVCERSKIPLHKWVLAMHLLCASKKGMSSHQLHRMLGVTYKTAWFMSHRLREAMREPATGEGGPALGGANRVVEADETFVGGKAKNAKRGKPVPPKEVVMALVERDGRLRSFHVANVTARTLRTVLTEQIDRASYLMTDEAAAYAEVGTEFGGHGTVNHSIEEYVRGGFWHTNTVEGYFAILKRGLYGTYHHVSPKHLKRYVGEFDFRYNHREASDFERAEAALKGIEGRRLTYRRPDQRAGA